MQRTLSRVRCEQVGSSNIVAKPARVNPAEKRRQRFQHCVAITPRRVGAFHGAQLAEQ
jgi:hypothetical protein